MIQKFTTVYKRKNGLALLMESPLKKAESLCLLEAESTHRTNPLLFSLYVFMCVFNSILSFFLSLKTKQTETSTAHQPVLVWTES